MSQVSNWLGAPRLKIMITAFSSLPLETAPSAWRVANLERVSPRAPSAPTWRKSRRVIPSHVVIEPSPVTVNMVSPFLELWFQAPLSWQQPYFQTSPILDGTTPALIHPPSARADAPGRSISRLQTACAYIM